MAKDNSLVSCTCITHRYWLSEQICFVKKNKTILPCTAIKNKESKREKNQERKTDKGRERQINKKKPYGTINA